VLELDNGSVPYVYDGDGSRILEPLGGTTTKFLEDNKMRSEQPCRKLTMLRKIFTD
jgi:hypothetical protein